MSVPRPVHVIHRTIASVAIVALLSSSLLAQTGQSTQTTLPNGPQAKAQSQDNYAAPLTEYTHANSILSVWKPYVPHTLPQPVMSNSDRLHSLIKDGKLMLSMNDAVALVMENNFDIAIARYNLDAADMDILRAKAGASLRGVSSGLLSGTPGGASTSASTSGTTGSGAGGTTAGAGGSTSGTGGLVSSTLNSVGSAIDSYDPSLSAKLSGDRSRFAVSQPLFYGGLTSVSENTNTYNFAFSQAWSTGTLAQVSYSNQRQTLPGQLVAAGIVADDPQLTGAWQVTVRQHLLQGWGIDNNRRNIISAINNRKATSASFRAQVISTVAQIQNIYWDLVNAYEDVKVEQQNLEYSQRTLSDNKKQVEIGTLAPIEVVSAQSTVAAAQQKLILSQTKLQYQQLIIKNAIARNFNDPALTAAVVIPTDTMAISNEQAPPVEELVNYAIANDPGLLQSEINLRNYELSSKAAKNGLLPSLDLYGYYGTSGLANNYGDVFSGIVNRTSADKGAYVQLSIPLRNRSAQADQVSAELSYRQTQLSLQQAKNTLNLAVRNAAFTLEQDRAAVEAARAARDYNQQSLEAEQKKYDLGASTSTLVLQQLNNATSAAFTYVQALSNYEKDRVALDKVTTQILDRSGIMVEDAVSGQVTHMPSVPGLQPNSTPATVAAPVQK